MTKYEYKVLNAEKNKELKQIWTKPDAYEEFLNSYGSQGWRLLKDTDMGRVFTVIFIREI